MRAAVPLRLEPVLFGLAALLLYLALAADAFYKVDGIDLVWLLQEKQPHPWHPGYLPALGLFRDLLGWCGLAPGALRLGAWFSAVGAALGVAFVRAGAGRLGLAPVVGRLATAAFALSPGVLTFATVVEFHGPMLAPLGLAFWWATVQIGRPSLPGMVLLGLLCHLPFLIHSQQLLFPVWLLALFLARQGLGARSLRLAALAGGVHLVLILALPRLLPGCYGLWADLGQGVATEGATGRPQGLEHTPAIFLQEWLLPQLPLSVLVFAAVMRRRLHLEFAAFAVGFLPYLYLSVRQLVDEPEFGAYLLPMVLPAAMLTARRFAGRRSLWPVLLVGVYVWYIGPHELLQQQRRVDDDFAIRVGQAAGGKPVFLLVGNHRELGSAYARLAPDEFLWVQPTAFLPRDALDPVKLAGMEFLFRQLHGEGTRVLATRSAMDTLRNPRAARLAEKGTLEVPPSATMAGPVLEQHLRAKFDIVHSEGREIWELEPK